MIASRAAPKRTPRACDECRRLKIRCESLESLRHSTDGEFSNEVRRCRGCQSSGIECKYTAPIHKRGPPKGYLNALEQRLNEAEALLGALLCSKDPRAVTLMSDLRKDQLASSIIHPIAYTKFGPQGRAEQARSGALHSAKTEPADFHVDSQGHLVFTSPSNIWQDYLDMRLNVDMKARLNTMADSRVELSSLQHALPSIDLSSYQDLFAPDSMSSSIGSVPFTEEIDINAWLTGDGHLLQTPLGL